MVNDSNTAILFQNARIWTASPDAPEAEAMLVQGGRIEAIGTEETVTAAVKALAPTLAAGAVTRRDLDGARVIPGLIDAHNHHAIAGRSLLYEVMFPPSAGYEHILEMVREAVGTTAADRWIMGGMVGSHLFERICTPAALAALDEASRGRPVCLRDDTCHNRWANSAALEAAGIGDTTPDPEGGRIVRDGAGKAVGVLLENAAALVDELVEKANYADETVNRKSSLHAIGILHSFGITAFQDAFTSLGTMRALSGLDNDGALTAWTVLSLPAHKALFVPDKVGVELFEEKEAFRTKHVRPDFAKIALDGVPTSRTAAMLEPYKPSPSFACCFRGGTTMPLPALAKLLGDCEAHNLAVKIHCTGDASLQMALDAIEVLRCFNGPSPLRHQIAHASLIAPNDIPRLAELGVTADLSPVMWYPSIIEQAIRETVPDERVDKMWPVRDFLAAGILVAAGSDWPVIPNPDPWDGIQGLVTRKNPNGDFPGTLGADQAISVEAALRAYTADAAKALGLEDDTGMLRAGLSADFAVLDQDVLKIDPEQIIKTRVLETWFAGRKVFVR